MITIPAIASMTFGTKLALAATGATIAVCVVARARPSTLVRVAEDGVLGMGKASADAVKAGVHKATEFGHTVRMEMRARQIDRLQQAISIEAEQLRDMDPEARAKLAADEARIFARADELRKEREGKPTTRAKKRAYKRASKRQPASPAGSTVTA